MRIVTHPSIFRPPSALADSLVAAEQIRGHPSCVALRPGVRHWAIFADLCRSAGAVGNAIPDAYNAALAIEHGCEFVTTDRGFARFPGCGGVIRSSRPDGRALVSCHVRSDRSQVQP